MFGAIIGDIVGSRFEFNRSNKTKDFELFGTTFARCYFTDDTVMTIAVAKALLDSGKNADIGTIKRNVINSMQKWGRQYPNAGYGIRFNEWLRIENPQPYNSYGNGSAMRVSSVGWLYDTIERVREVARATAEVSHNHPEGIKGAEAVASAIFFARIGHSKEEIKEYIVKEFGYDLNRTCNEIRQNYRHVESCQETVPEAVSAFLEGRDFEDVIRTAISLGGDADTLTAIAGSIAEAYYGIPEEIYKKMYSFLKKDLRDVCDIWYETYSSNIKDEMIRASRFSDITKNDLIMAYESQGLIGVCQMPEKRTQIEKYAGDNCVNSGYNECIDEILNMKH